MNSQPADEKRYFYTDPLAVAWNAKHHGMRFKWVEGDEPKQSWREDGKDILYSLMWFDEIDYSNGPKLYDVHPESLHLLKPLVGDLLECESKNPGGQRSHFWYDVLTPLTAILTQNVKRIIQRDGIPFMWPESEPA